MLKKNGEAICSFPHLPDTLTKENPLTWHYKEETNSSITKKYENKHEGEKTEEKSGCLFQSLSSPKLCSLQSRSKHPAASVPSLRSSLHWNCAV